METISVALVLLLAVVLSSTIARASPIALPLPLFQIALGALIASVADLGVLLNPDIFFLLFLPPLLFLDGWRIPKEGLFRDMGAILQLALGLVVFTVLGVGFLVHWMIPTMPLAVAFALAAIVSPTDPIAVSAIAERVPVPERLMHILEGESLLNDASGLVCMRFAVAAMLTGQFSLATALGTFVWLAIGGIAVGVAVTWLIARAKAWVSRKFGEETGPQILISLLIPFAAYLVAEKLNCSSILAAVAAGITMSYVERSGAALAVTRVRRTVVWETIQFAANGVIFVLLGEQLPHIVTSAASVVQQTGHVHPLWLLGYAAAITLALAALRLAWVWTSMRFSLAWAAHRGRERYRPGWRLIAAASVAGVRGTITLAGVLTLPFTLYDGSPFPARELAVFLAAAVIILSLAVASLALPRLLRNLKLPPAPSHREEEDRVRAAAAQAAIKAVEDTGHDLGEGRADADAYADAAARVMQIYRWRLDAHSKTGEDVELVHKGEAIERRLRLAGLRAERRTVLQYRRSRRINEETARQLFQEIDLAEARIGSRA